MTDYVTLSQVKAYMPENEVSTSSLWDGMVSTLCTNLSRLFDTLTWRNPGDYAVSADSARWFDAPLAVASGPEYSLPIGEIAAAPTSVVVDGQLINSSDYWLAPYNALAEFRPYTSIDLTPESTLRSWGVKRRSICVTAKFGYSTTVPPVVYEGLLLFVARFVRKAQQNYLETGTLLDSGQLMVTSKRDEDLQSLILHYRKSRLYGP